jgi:hypothetical protein
MKEEVNLRIEYNLLLNKKLILLWLFFSFSCSKDVYIYIYVCFCVNLDLNRPLCEVPIVKVTIKMTGVTS